jgi:hypothetical protein
MFIMGVRSVVFITSLQKKKTFNVSEKMLRAFRRIKGRSIKTLRDWTEEAKQPIALKLAINYFQTGHRC